MRSYSMKPVIFPMSDPDEYRKFLKHFSPSTQVKPWFTAINTIAMLLRSHSFLVGCDLAARGLGRRFDTAFQALQQRPLVLVGEHLDELQPRLSPTVEQLARALAASPAVVVAQQALQLRLVALVAMPAGLVVGVLLGSGHHPVHRHHGGIATTGELAVFVIHIGDATAHAGGKIAAGFAKHRHGSAGHVFAAMIAGALNNLSLIHI